MSKACSFILCVALLLAILPSMAVAQTHDLLRAFLQQYVSDPSIEEDKTASYLEAWVDLNGDGEKEVIVYLMEQSNCGSGGCRTVILQTKGSSYRIVTETTITRLPIRILTTKSHGWYDLTVRVQGGGILKPYEAELRFNGKTYPSNPTMPPARHLRETPKGEVLIPAEDYDSGKPLYP
jgi:hypothetical protein